MSGKSSNWPRTGDTLFAAGLAWEDSALVSIGVDSFLHYALSYKEAADMVVEQVKSSHASPDAIILPVFVLYRHCLELMLKALIRLGGLLEGTGQDFPRTHQLELLWKECRPLLERTFPDGEKADTNAVESCIRELAALDPSGEASRYPEKKDGASTIPQDVPVSLHNIREVMSRIGGFLTGSYDAMDALLLAQPDSESMY